MIPLLSLAAPALAVNVKLCAKYQVQYRDSGQSDNETGSDALGDWFATNSNKVARGARIRVIRHQNGAITDQYAAWDGADAGCSTFDLVGGAQYDVQIHSVAQVNGNTVAVYDDDQTPAIWSSLALDNWNAPTSAGTVDIATANAHRAWHTAAAAGHALWRRNGGMTNKTFDFYTDYEDTSDPCDGSPSCTSDGDVYLGDQGYDERFNIVHEMGHAFQHFLTGGIPSSGGADPGECWSINEDGTSHEMTSKEHQSMAIQEAHAHYYAAVAFNDTSESDCGFIYYKGQDYDLNRDSEADGSHPISCEDGPVFTTPGVATTAFMENYCDAPLTDRGNELDWLRFLWDLDSGYASVGTTEINTILQTAVVGVWVIPPHAWVAVPNGSTPSADRPYIRMRDAATALGLQSEWSSKLANGVDH